MTAPARRELIWLLVPLGLAVAVFARGLQGTYVYDDELLIARNPAFHDGLLAAITQPLWGAELGHWRPLTSALLWLGNALGGALPLHVLSLLVHGVGITAAFLLARCALGSRPHGLAAAAAAAALFAVHPVQAESVAWIAAINDPLWGCAALLAMSAFWRWRQRGSPGLPWSAVFGLAVGLAAKETAVAILPLLLVVDRAVSVPAAAVPRPLVRAYVPLLVVLLVYLALRALVFGDLAAGLGRSAVESGAAMADPARLLTLRVELFGRLVGILCWPWPPGLFREVQATVAVTDLAFLGHAGLACGLVVLVAVAVLWRWSIVLLCGGSVLASLLPELIWIEQLGPYPVADRYLYPGVFGLALAVVASCSARWQRRRVDGSLLLVGLIVVVAFGAGSSLRRVGQWADPLAFARTATRQHPTDARAHYMLGRQQLEAHRRGQTGVLAGAQTELQRALVLLDRPRYGRARIAASIEPEIRLGLAWCELYQAVQKNESPVVAERRFAAVVERWPDSANAHVGLGVAAAMAQRWDVAEPALRRAVELAPDNPRARFNLGRLLFLRRDLDGAEEQLAAALRIRPDDAETVALRARIEAAR